MMNRFIMLISVFVFCSPILSAQDVAGIKVGTKMSKRQVIAKFGLPDNYSCSDAGELGVDEIYYYGENSLSFNNNEFIGFFISDKKWPVLVSWIDGGIRVGEPLSSISSLNPQKAGWLGPDVYFVPNGDFPIFFRLKSGVICEISFEFTN